MEAEWGLRMLYSQSQRLAKPCALRHRVDQLGVEEFTPEPASERLGKTVLPRVAWLDMAGVVALSLRQRHRT